MKGEVHSVSRYRPTYGQGRNSPGNYFFCRNTCNKSRTSKMDTDSSDILYLYKQARTLLFFFFFGRLGLKCPPHPPSNACDEERNFILKLNNFALNPVMIWPPRQTQRYQKLESLRSKRFGCYACCCVAPWSILHSYRCSVTYSGRCRWAWPPENRNQKGERSF